MASQDTLPIDVVVSCTRQAQRDGLFTGLSSALAGGIIGSKLFRLNRNMALLSGAVTGIAVGYQLTQAFLATNLAQARAAHAKVIANSNEAAAEESNSSM